MKKIKELNGYRVLYKPEHPRAMKSDNWKGWIYEHSLLGEQIIGRPLRDNEVVHHLDGNRANNRIENLLVLERSQHLKLHEWLDRGAPFPEKEGMNGVNSVNSTANRFCEICSATLQQKQKKFCSMECSGQSRQKVEKPTKERLKKLMEDNSFLALGRLFGVSDNAVRKWARKYDLL